MSGPPTRSAAAWAGVLAAAACQTCFYVPQISEKPASADSPPFVLGFDPDMVVDLSETTDEVTVALDSVFDLNDPETIDYRFLFRLQPDDQRPVQVTGRLRSAAVQPFTGATAYDGPSLTLRRCRPPLDGVEGDIVTVSIELIDPFTSGEDLGDSDEYVVPLTWRLRLVGSCDGR
ncbi:MAG: hypothetical protein H6698_06765 [Myxococcales bacterium]|nr:hypothetical protein [Myxococcales bacterium]MCB9520999.1 hypothetical protein [Myxococcales bacterium]MCB9531674.1 hypothetical protein [Myxococcales bacterium]MCB9534009.1 hypothetical protein [Myxococcales bacterium]